MMISTISRFLALVAFLGLAGVPAFAGDITVGHMQGETAVPLKPAKVLVFDLAALDILDRLGVEAAGVPGGVKPAYLAKYNDDGILKIGTLFEPDYEAVNAAGADLIIVGGRSAAKYPELSKIAPTIDLTGDPKDFLGSIRRNVEVLGRIFGKEAQASREIDDLDAAVGGLKKKAQDKGNGLLILTTGGKVSAYGPGSRFGILHDAFGVVPAAPGLATGNHGQPVSFEFILETNPDWLFVIDRDAAIGREGSPARQLLDNELVGQTTAWKKQHVVYLDPANWYLVGGGLTSLHQSIDQISKAFDEAS
ncbi:MAG: siderophore ABC transporter substrate-binding protein [Rhizobiales bacterium]|nr:siderophore ABC transporter substrate-binding protein [Hyphomicrobiales bacterium]